MRLQEMLKRPLVVFDIESTGTDPEQDKIVEICLLRIEPDGSETCLTELVNPGIPIPREATAVH
ncbi:MAG: exonuclease domain-containing protein, partial [Patescibacteria group bacterium]